MVVENCSGCALSAWGWQDNEYGGLTPGAAIYFERSGPQILRIQGREDGISIDQVVLSSSTYYTTSPGAISDDATILDRTDFSIPLPGSRQLAFTTTDYVAAAFDIAALRDLNGDGLPDAAGLYDSAPVTLYSALNTGARTFAHAQLDEMWGGPEGPRSLELMDVTRDGRADLVFHDRSYNRLVVRPGAAGGTFAAPITLMNFGEHVADFLLADFNRDGTADMITTEPQRNAAVTYLGNGNGTFTFFAWVSSGPSPTLVATGDFNGDGYRDIATLSHDEQTVYFSIGDGTGRFPRQASVPTGAQPRALVVRDLNRDGFDDIVVANAGATVTVHLGMAAGAFTPPREFVSSRISGMTVRDDGLAIADVNGDAHPDLLVQQYAGTADTGFSASIAVLPGAGDGTFTEPDEFGSWATGPILTSDLDGDGRQEVFLPNGNRGFGVMWNDPADANRLPVANAGPDVTVEYSQQAAFRLNAARSQDADSHAMTYSWRDADGIEFSTGISPKPFVSPRQPGSYTFTLSVDDLHGGRSSDSVTVTIVSGTGTAANRAPTVTAGASLGGTWPYHYQFREQADPITYLYAQATDPDGDPLTYEWRNAAGEIIGTEGSMQPSILRPGAHQFGVIVRDGRGGQASNTVTVTVTPYEEIVITAGYKEQIVGSHWQRFEQYTSAGALYDELSVRNANAGAAKVNEPIASPSSYVEFTFPADPTQEYKLWIRMKAENDYWGNDSVWVQFTGATDAAGTPKFRAGTNSGLWINLEECSGCGVAGWGWRDDAWGTAGIASNTRLRFPEGGLQTIRIQAREDGASIDTIVLSSAQYRTRRPGAVKNDTTRLWLTAEWGH